MWKHLQFVCVRVHMRYIRALFIGKLLGGLVWFDEKMQVCVSVSYPL